MADPLRIFEPEEAVCARVRRSLSTTAAATVDALDPAARRWLLLSLDHASLVSSLENLHVAKRINPEARDALPTDARALFDDAFEAARLRLMPRARVA